jgi:hypothetical protein
VCAGGRRRRWSGFLVGFAALLALGAVAGMAGMVIVATLVHPAVAVVVALGMVMLVPVKLFLLAAHHQGAQRDSARVERAHQEGLAEFDAESGELDEGDWDNPDVSQGVRSASWRMRSRSIRREPTTRRPTSRSWSATPEGTPRPRRSRPPYSGGCGKTLDQIEEELNR